MRTSRVLNLVVGIAAISRSNTKSRLKPHRRRIFYKRLQDRAYRIVPSANDNEQNNIKRLTVFLQELRPHRKVSLPHGIPKSSHPSVYRNRLTPNTNCDSCFTPQRPVVRSLGLTLGAPRHPVKILASPKRSLVAAVMQTLILQPGR